MPPRTVSIQHEGAGPSSPFTSSNTRSTDVEAAQVRDADFDKGSLITAPRMLFRELGFQWSSVMKAWSHKDIRCAMVDADEPTYLPHMFVSRQDGPLSCHLFLQDCARCSSDTKFTKFCPLNYKNSIHIHAFLDSQIIYRDGDILEQKSFRDEEDGHQGVDWAELGEEIRIWEESGDEVERVYTLRPSDRRAREGFRERVTPPTVDGRPTARSYFVQRQRDASLDQAVDIRSMCEHVLNWKLPLCKRDEQRRPNMGQKRQRDAGSEANLVKRPRRRAARSMDGNTTERPNPVHRLPYDPQDIHGQENVETGRNAASPLSYSIHSSHRQEFPSPRSDTPQHDFEFGPDMMEVPDHTSASGNHGSGACDNGGSDEEESSRCSDKADRRRKEADSDKIERLERTVKNQDILIRSLQRQVDRFERDPQYQELTEEIEVLHEHIKSVKERHLKEVEDDLPNAELVEDLHTARLDLSCLKIKFNIFTDAIMDESRGKRHMPFLEAVTRKQRLECGRLRRLEDENKELETELDEVRKELRVLRKRKYDENKLIQEAESERRQYESWKTKNDRILKRLENEKAEAIKSLQEGESRHSRVIETLKARMEEILHEKMEMARASRDAEYETSLQLEELTSVKAESVEAHKRLQEERDDHAKLRHDLEATIEELLHETEGLSSALNNSIATSVHLRQEKARLIGDIRRRRQDSLDMLDLETAAHTDARATIGQLRLDQSLRDQRELQLGLELDASVMAALHLVEQLASAEQEIQTFEDTTDVLLCRLGEASEDISRITAQLVASSEKREALEEELRRYRAQNSDLEGLFTDVKRAMDNFGERRE
ncbi:hypothetical protein BD324DRAFT_286651 [Kockovaella imperatae]|uniref:Uncharacterized protein n=1 Tax=Kockovaella imperatae TaxID=4999 RepID=A0A1Y1U5L9_9TREE|nr:hypothetical protein BD324DRAFT_286651 [Kockovaella imperatae]ORX33323.1 hypothetical protein BD324DRAFT_286651 [Kockovaella imperatae]